MIQPRFSTLGIMQPADTIDRLFRHESGKLVSILTRIFGTHNLDLVEDVVQDSLLKALEHWKYRGIPENPTAWLITVARNKALDTIRREQNKKEFTQSISPLLKSAYSASATIQQQFDEAIVEDEQLRMMFVCCHPAIAEEAQVALVLKTLCGFSISEIAKAFVQPEETISKRLYRAREQFRQHKIPFTLPQPDEISNRLKSVLTCIYLIFNEGYNSTHHPSIIREDLIEESLRLVKLLSDHKTTNKPETFALLALLCFQSARLYSRIDTSGNLIPLKEQDRSTWNQSLIQQGIGYLQKSSSGEHPSEYHIQAMIAFEHCATQNFASTNWLRIIELYDWLYRLRPDPLIALNRLIAFAELNGPQAALNEVKNIKDRDLLDRYYLYPATLGEWHYRLGNREISKKYFQQALELTQSPAERILLESKLTRA